MARLPIGLAGRTAIGWGSGSAGDRPRSWRRRYSSARPSRSSASWGAQGRRHEAGQALSIFEAALPPEIASPYRATLTRLQEAAPPLPARTVHQVLTRELGEDWRDYFPSSTTRPAAAASIGQVHEAVCMTAPPVA